MPAEKTLAQKLLLKPGATLALVNAPTGQTQPEGTTAAKAATADAVLLYVVNTKQLDAKLPAVVKSLKDDARLWIAYPKAGKLDTDLNRDLLWQRLEPTGLRGVRQVAVDETWSALWFKRE